MAASAKQSVERLLASCESLVSGERQFRGRDWKLSQYVLALRQQLTELETHHSVDEDTMDMFQHKVSALEGVVCDLSTNPESASPAGGGTGDDDTGRGERGERGVPVDERPLLAKSPSQREAEARAELFAQSPSSERGLRHRGSGSAPSPESSEVAMERQRRNQEAIAGEMMGIARSLKNNAMAARNIISGDNKVLEETNRKADGNITAIDTQTGRIKEHNRGCPWGTILLLVLVFVVFLAMVFLVRLVPKPRY